MFPFFDVVAPIVKELMHPRMCWKCSYMTIDFSHNTCTCGKTIDAERNLAIQRTIRDVIKRWTYMVDIHTQLQAISELIHPSRESVIIITNMRVICPSIVNRIALIRVYANACKLFHQSKNLSLDVYLYLLENRYPYSIYRPFGELVATVDRLEESWALDETMKYAAYVQWLPREMMDDVISLL